jgi:DNA-binding CsgD family transcriptional regulator
MRKTGLSLKPPKPAAAILKTNKLASFEGLKSLPVSVAIVDASGTIVAVNKTWQQFGRRNGLRVPGSALGMNYLHYCPTDEPDLRRFITQLKALLAGKVDLLTFIYPCHSRTQARWFCLIGLPLSQSNRGGVALLHVNLTAMFPLVIGARKQRAKAPKAPSHRQPDSALGGLLERSVLEPLSAQLNAMFAARVISETKASNPVNTARARLSKRQMEVLKLLGQGKTNKEIASALFRSPNTVKLHVSAILERLKLKGRVQAALLSSKLLQNDSDPEG